MSEEDMHKYMLEAIKKAEKNFTSGKGGPFGAVIVRDGKIIAVGGNKVTSANDPTAHAEIVAIRKACKKLGTFNLSGCEIFASCEPCPMCLSAIMWARIGRLFYASSRNDASRAGFDDDILYAELALPAGERMLKPVQLLQEEAIKVFDKWVAAPDKIPY
jgi:guanine deaminase